jgi:hypothetical protein
MHNAALMSDMDGPGQQLNQARSFAWEGPSAQQALRQRAALDIFQRQIRPAVVIPYLVNLNNVRVLELSHGLRFGVKPGQCKIVLGTLMDHLERDSALQPGFECLVNYTHAAATKDLKDLIGAHMNWLRGLDGQWRAARERSKLWLRRDYRSSIGVDTGRSLDRCGTALGTPGTIGVAIAVRLSLPLVAPGTVDDVSCGQ